MNLLERHAREGERRRLAARRAAMSPIEYREHCAEARRKAKRRFALFGTERGVVERNEKNARRRRSAKERHVLLLGRPRRRSPAAAEEALVRLKDGFSLRVNLSEQGLGSKLSARMTCKILRYLRIDDLSRLGRTSTRMLLVCADNAIWRAKCDEEGSTTTDTTTTATNWRLEFRWRRLRRRQAEIWRMNYAQGRVGRMRRIPRPEGRGYDAWAVRRDENGREGGVEILYGFDFERGGGGRGGIGRSGGFSGDMDRAIEPGRRGARWG